MRRLRFATALSLIAGLALGCGVTRRYDQALAVLIDVSGTYADETAEAVRLVKRDVLPSLMPGDTLLIVRIDSESYHKENVELLVTFDDRPSRSNAQKLAVARTLDGFAARAPRSKFSDIPGAMMLAADYLRETEASSKVLVVLSDLHEELPAGQQRPLAGDEFAGLHFVALNVKQLRSDAADPSDYRMRLASWEERVGRSGGLGWRTLMNPEKLGDHLGELREARGGARAEVPDMDVASAL